MNKYLDVLEKVVHYELNHGGGFIPGLMAMTILPIKKLIEEDHTLDPNFFENFSLPTHPMEWYVDEGKVIRARAMNVRAHE